MVSLSKKKSSRLSKASRSRNFNLKKNSNFNLEKNNKQGESSDFSWELGFESESKLTKEDEIEREWNIEFTVGDNTLAVGNEKIELSIDVAGVGFSVSNDSGGTIGIGLGIVGIEYNVEGGGELDYFNGLYKIEIEKEGCTYVKDYYFGGIYTHTEIELIPNCDGREPKDEWDTGPSYPPEELSDDEKNGNLPPGQRPEPPDVDDNCLVWAMVSYVFYSYFKEKHGGGTHKSTMLLTEVTPLKEIRWSQNYQERLYDVGIHNITSTLDFGYRVDRRPWNLPGHHREEFFRGSYRTYIPIPGNGATILFGNMEYVRGYIQNELYYDFDNYKSYIGVPGFDPSKVTRYVGRIHSIQWYSDCEPRLPPPYWPLGNYKKDKKDMKDKCCFTEDDRTRLMLTTTASGGDKKGGYPVLTPKSLQGFSQEKVKIRSTPEYIAYLHQYLDEILGQYPVTVQIPDTDPAKPGDQKSSPRDIPNISELLAETYGLALQEAIDRSDKRLEYGLASEIELLKIAMFRLDYKVGAIADYLDFDEAVEKKEIKLAFNPADEDNFLERSKRRVEVTFFKEDARTNPSLNTVLNKLLVAAQSIQQAFRIPINPGNITGSLIDFFKGVAGESEQDKLKRVTDLLESGKLNNDNIGIEDNPKVRKPNSEESNQS